MADQDGVLELLDLRRRFGETIALDGLSFSVPPGQVFGFLGPNGAGKTTAMRAIVGVAALDGGSVRWNGAPIGEQARRPASGRGGRRPAPYRAARPQPVATDQEPGQPNHGPGRGDPHIRDHSHLWHQDHDRGR